MTNRILLVNPPIYDFTAYDFWLKPYGMLRVAGMLRGQAELALFDYLDRNHPQANPAVLRRPDPWGRGDFEKQDVEKPPPLRDIPRRYRRFGIDRTHFRDFLQNSAPFDYAFVQTVMTYWYPGVREVIEDLRTYAPRTKIVLGGVYATICHKHAQSLGADFVVGGLNLDPLWRWMNLEPDAAGLPFWEGYPGSASGTLKLADGCPFRCTYCSVPRVYPKFEARELDRSMRELEFLISRGIDNIVFYDDALLFRVKEILLPFLERARQLNARINFHTPNALNARFITPEIAGRMVQGGFKTFYLGFESSAFKWQKSTGGKVYSHEFTRAVESLCASGARRENITAYLIAAHPHDDGQQLEDSMRFVNGHGVRVMLSEFSPIPGTPDGESCRPIADLDEPLNHNKTAFALRHLGEKRVETLKLLSHQLNRSLKSALPIRA